MEPCVLVRKEEAATIHVLGYTAGRQQGETSLHHLSA